MGRPSGSARQRWGGRLALLGLVLVAAVGVGVVMPSGVTPARVGRRDVVPDHSEARARRRRGHSDAPSTPATSRCGSRRPPTCAGVSRSTSPGPVPTRPAARSPTSTPATRPTRSTPSCSCSAAAPSRAPAQVRPGDLLDPDLVRAVPEGQHVRLAGLALRRRGQRRTSGWPRRGTRPAPGGVLQRRPRGAVGAVRGDRQEDVRRRLGRVRRHGARGGQRRWCGHAEQHDVRHHRQGRPGECPVHGVDRGRERLAGLLQRGALLAGRGAGDRASAATPTGPGCPRRPDRPRARRPGRDTACRAADVYQPGDIATAGRTPNPAVTGALWWSPSNWSNRITVPLTFAVSSDVCSVLNPTAAALGLRLGALR